MTESDRPRKSALAQSLESSGLLMLVVGLVACAATSAEAAILGAGLMIGGAVFLIASRIARYHSWAALVIVVLGAGAGGFFCLNSLRRSAYIRRADEKETRMELAGLRASLAAYRDANSWKYPYDLAALGLKPLPATRLQPLHRRSNAWKNGSRPDDAGGWLYDADPKSGTFGQVWVNCTHTDTRGKAWTSY